MKVRRKWHYISLLGQSFRSLTENCWQTDCKRFPQSKDKNICFYNIAGFHRIKLSTGVQLLGSVKRSIWDRWKWKQNTTLRTSIRGWKGASPSTGSPAIRLVHHQRYTVFTTLSLKSCYCFTFQYIYRRNDHQGRMLPKEPDSSRGWQPYWRSRTRVGTKRSGK